MDARIDGRYRVLETLGEGAAARVLLCRDEELDREVAVKLLLGGSAVSDPERFADEARVLARLRHPHIVEVFDVGVDAGTPFLVLEVVRGGNLLDLLPPATPDVAELRRVAGQTLEALHHAHQEGILHRDVKPENVLLTAEGVPKLTDFGIAKNSESGIRTRTGLVLGTPAFMAPEVIMGKPATPASDIYSWGCLVYCLVNGRPPHDGTPGEIAKAALAGTYPQGAETGRLARVIEGALATRPEARADAPRLLAILQGKGLGTVPLASRSARRRSLALGGAALGALLALGAAAAIRSRPPALAAPPEGPAPVAEHLATLRRWARELRDLETAAWIRETHGACAPGLGEGSYRGEMLETRRGTPKGVRLAVLRAAAEALPHRTGFARDVPLLRAALEDPGIAADEKLDLLEVVQRLEHVDRYLAAWGEPPAYGAERVRRALSDSLHRRYRPPEGEETAVREDRVLGPGTHLLFRWEEGPDRDYPWLEPSVGVRHQEEVLGLLQGQHATGGRFDESRHGALEGRFRLGPEPARVLGRAAILLDAANFFVPDLLQVTVNGITLDHPADPRWCDHANWKWDVFPSYEIEVGIPLFLLREGLNRVRVTVRPLPGLTRRSGMEVDRLRLHLASRGP